MQRPDELGQHPEVSGHRLSRLSEATLRVNEALDFESALQKVVDSARVLTGAGYGVITTMDDTGQPEDIFTSGMTAEERRQIGDTRRLTQLLECLSRFPGPLRVADFYDHIRARGLPKHQSLPAGAFLAAPICHRGDVLGSIYLAGRKDGPDFTREDEETLVIFAAQAAPVIANARRCRDEQWVRSILQTLIDTSPVGVAVFDARAGTPLLFNQEAVRIMQNVRLPDRPTEQLLEVLRVRRADGREVSLAEFPFAQLLSDGETVRSEEVVISLPDDRSVTVLANVTPMHSEDGNVESTVVTIQDVTQLQELERLRAEFLGMVSHELRAPLTSIKGSTDTLLESLGSLDPAEVMQFLRIIRSQAALMQDLIRELLDVARIESGTFSVSPEPAEIAALVDEGRNIFLIGGGRDNIAIDLEPDLPWVMADSRRIVQVIGNLLANAARYSRETTTIRLSAAHKNGYVAVAVADEGRGIPPERLPFLFMKFSRLDSDGEQGVVDAGLGLAICKGIVEAHRGRIWAESAGLGLGTRFTFTLPVVDENGLSVAKETARPSGKSRQTSSEQTRVIVVVDDPTTLRSVRNALSKAGFFPLVTADPEEALRLVEDKRPRLALLDPMLPGSDGIELMKEILGIADVPVIFLSAYSNDEIIARAFEAGAADYMVKPFSPTELVARVRGAMRKQLP